MFLKYCYFYDPTADLNFKLELVYLPKKVNTTYTPEMFTYNTFYFS